MRSFTRLKFTENIITKIWINEDNSTDVEITFFDDLGAPVVAANGHTKLNPTDIFDSGVGVSIALGRAMERFGRKFTTWAESQSETPSLRKVRIRETKRIIGLGLIGDNLSRQKELEIMRAKRKRNGEALKNAPRAPKTTLEAVEVSEVAPSTTKA